MIKDDIVFVKSVDVTIVQDQNDLPDAYSYYTQDGPGLPRLIDYNDPYNLPDAVRHTVRVMNLIVPDGDKDRRIRIAYSKEAAKKIGVKDRRIRIAYSKEAAKKIGVNWEDICQELDRERNLSRVRFLSSVNTQRQLEKVLDQICEVTRATWIDRIKYFLTGNVKWIIRSWDQIEDLKEKSDSAEERRNRNKIAKELRCL